MFSGLNILKCKYLLPIAFLVITMAYGDVWPWADIHEAEETRQALADLIGHGSRIPGAPANKVVEERIKAMFEDSGFNHGALEFKAPLFHSGKTILFLNRDRSIELSPLHPSIVRPGNFKEHNFAARLVDLRDGSVAELAALDGVDLKDTIALMDFHSGRAWSYYLRFGVKGFIFVGDTTYIRQDAFDKVHTSDVSVPRFFVSQSDGNELRKAMGTKREIVIDIQAEPSTWESGFLSSPWVLIPGTHPVRSNEVVVVVAPIDANCVAPDLAYGGEAGANLYALIKLFQRFKSEPTDRTILLAAVNGRSQNCLGDRLLAWHLFSPSESVEAMRDVISRDMRQQEHILHFMEKLHLTPASRTADEKLLVELRTLTDDATGRQITVKAPLIALCQRDVNALKSEKMKLTRQSELAASDENENNLREIEKKLNRHLQVLTLFNRIGVRTRLSNLREDEIEILRGYVATVVARNRENYELNRAELERSVRNSGIRNVLGGRKPILVISLELSWTRPEIGFSSGIPYGGLPWADRFGRNSMAIAERIEAIVAGQKPGLLVNSLTQVGGLHDRFYVPDISPVAVCYQLADRVPALSLNTAYETSCRAFTPADTINALNCQTVAGNINYIEILLRKIFNDEIIFSATELPPPPVSADKLWSVQLKTLAYGEFATGVEPDVAVPNTIISLAPNYPPKVQTDGFFANGIIANYISITDARASVMEYGIREPYLCSAAFQFDENFINVRQILDMGEGHVKMDTDLPNSAISRTLCMIPCKELVLWNRAETPFLGMKDIDSNFFFPLNAVRNGAPRHYGISGAASDFSSKGIPPDLWGPVGFYTFNDERLKIVTRYKSIAVNAVDIQPDGIGFADNEEIGNDFFRQAMFDMGVINRHRLSELNAVANNLEDELLEKAETSATEMLHAEKNHRHVAKLQALHDGMGAQVKAYGQIAATGHDMLKAVVFYMALLMPFCFFMQKLLFRPTRIEMQLLLFALLFILCYAVFRVIHPAFRVAKAPEAMFIAFVMCALGMFVIWILHGRFEGEMALLFSNLTSAGGGHDDAAYGMVSQQAVMVGINNMRRRRVRTILTTATIVLMTFTMLAFTSISRRMSPTAIAQNRQAPYSGLIVHWPGSVCMDESSHRTLRELFYGHGDVVTRRWRLPRKVIGSVATLRAETMHGQGVMIDGVLGLELLENGLLGDWPLVAGTFFSDNRANEVIIADTLAANIGVSESDIGKSVMRFEGLELRLAGIVDSRKLRDLRDLNGLSILPVKQAPVPYEYGEAAATMQAETLANESNIFYVEPTALLILPEETARRVQAKPYSVSVRLKTGQPLWQLIERLLIATKARFFVGSQTPFAMSGDNEARLNKDGVYYVGAGYRTSIGGLATLLIPLMIAATIILNTMLGTVFERKREIAVFNAIGLNPTHIGIFFLAEAFVYGVIGAVGGYMLGQILNLLLNRMGWIKGVNLNFSSLSVAYVIVFTLVVVLLSTIYPAIVATRAAVPSGKRKWSMPVNDGNQMEVVFPFIYATPKLAAAVMSYLYTFFNQYTEASLGDMIAQPSGTLIEKDHHDQPVFILNYELALAPFDLGVTQAVAFNAAFDEAVGAYRVSMSICRKSGQDSNWIATNKPYLETLRRLLLNWRSLAISEREEHAMRAVNLFNLKEDYGNQV